MYGYNFNKVIIMVISLPSTEFESQPSRWDKNTPTFRTQNPIPKFV